MLVGLRVVAEEYKSSGERGIDQSHVEFATPPPKSLSYYTYECLRYTTSNWKQMVLLH